MQRAWYSRSQRRRCHSRLVFSYRRSSSFPLVVTLFLVVFFQGFISSLFFLDFRLLLQSLCTMLENPMQCLSLNVFELLKERK